MGGGHRPCRAAGLPSVIVAADGVYGTAAEWAAGPEAVYTVLARRLVDEVPAVLRGTLCLDVGAGTGVLSHMLVERGGTAVEIDLSLAMLRWRRSWRPPAIVADVRRLPMRGASIDRSSRASSSTISHRSNPGFVSLPACCGLVGGSSPPPGQPFPAPPRR